MRWFLFVLFLSLPFSSLAEGRLEKKLPSAIIVGAVNCDTCYQQVSSKYSHFISECKSDDSEPSFREDLKADEKGEFVVHLPLSISKYVERIKACTVHLVSSNQPYCSVASTATSSALHLQSRKQGEYIFSAGILSFKPQNQANTCNQDPITLQFTQLSSVKTFLPSYKPAIPQADQGLTTVSLSRVKGKGKIHTVSANKVHHSNPNEAFTEQTFVPILLQPTLPVPNPLQPVPNPLQPTLPVPNPLQPTLPVPNPLQPILPIPNPIQPTLPVPNPLQPPPLIPKPLQPPPLIPNPLQPPSAPLIPQPPLLGLTPPVPPSMPVPFPQLPLPPIPPFSWSAPSSSSK